VKVVKHYEYTELQTPSGFTPSMAQTSLTTCFSCRLRNKSTVPNLDTRLKPSIYWTTSLAAEEFRFRSNTALNVSKTETNSEGSREVWSIKGRLKGGMLEMRRQRSSIEAVEFQALEKSNKVMGLFF